MDGSNAGFLLDDSFLSTRGSRSDAGILYIEDFGADIRPPEPPALEPPPPTYSADELAAAREAGRQEGVQAALSDAGLVQAQLQSAALQSLADGLAAARAALDAAARAHAAELERTVLAVLQAAIPAVMRNHAAAEMAAVLRALLPGMLCEPELRVRAHADMADLVREQLIAALPRDTCVLSVCVDPALDVGDVHISWQDGHAQRDTRAIWDQIAAALSPLSLPTMEDICHGC